MASVHGRPVGAGAPNEKDGVAFRNYAVLSFIGRSPPGHLYFISS